MIFCEPLEVCYLYAIRICNEKWSVLFKKLKVTLLTLTTPPKVKPMVSYVPLKFKILGDTRLATLQSTTSHSQHLNSGKPLGTMSGCSQSQRRQTGRS